MSLYIFNLKNTQHHGTDRDHGIKTLDYFAKVNVKETKLERISYGLF